MNRIFKLIIYKLKEGNKNHVNTIYTHKDFDIEEFMRTIEYAAWTGSRKRLAALHGVDENAMLIFSGRIYEPTYEYFEGTCDVFIKLDGKMKELYSQKDISIAPYRHEVKVTGRKADIIDFVKNHFSNGFTIHYPLEETADKY